ncbi:MAG: hypothetical protein WDN28_17230 [Chthoniobacter sp.]
MPGSIRDLQAAVAFAREVGFLKQQPRGHRVLREIHDHVGHLVAFIVQIVVPKVSVLRAPGFPFHRGLALFRRDRPAAGVAALRGHRVFDQHDVFAVHLDQARFDRFVRRQGQVTERRERA